MTNGTSVENFTHGLEYTVRLQRHKAAYLIIITQELLTSLTLNLCSMCLIHDFNGPVVGIATTHQKSQVTERIFRQRQISWRSAKQFCSPIHPWSMSKRIRPAISICFKCITSNLRISRSWPGMGRFFFRPTDNQSLIRNVELMYLRLKAGAILCWEISGYMKRRNTTY